MWTFKLLTYFWRRSKTGFCREKLNDGKNESLIFCLDKTITRSCKQGPLSIDSIQTVKQYGSIFSPLKTWLWKGWNPFSYSDAIQFPFCILMVFRRLTHFELILTLLKIRFEKKPAVYCVPKKILKKVKEPFRVSSKSNEYLICNVVDTRFQNFSTSFSFKVGKYSFLHNFELFVDKS